MIKNNVNDRLFTLNCNGRLLAATKPLVMGIINVTPDSFYPGSRFRGIDKILEQAEKMMREGADILDIGAQSTRPGSVVIGPGEELTRLTDILESLCTNFPEAVISIDTYHSQVATEAVAAGAGIVNDITGGMADPDMIECVGKLRVPYICSHAKGSPDVMHNDPYYENLCREIVDYFITRIELCKKAGIHDVIIDPGFGFSKTVAHNFELLRNLSVFKIFDKPLMAGISRKSTIYKTLGTSSEHALNGTTVLNTICLLNGADILRVHDVKEAVEVITLIRAYYG